MNFDRRKRHKMTVQPWILAICVFCLSAGLRAQLSTASVNGTVRDSSGAVVPGVSIVLQNLETGVIQRTVTNGQGNYVLLNVPPGRYRLEASKAGFVSQTRSNLILTVNQTTTYDFTLAVGSTRQSVTVQAAPVRVEFSTAELGTAVMRREVNNLPLNGRNFTQLLELTPGVSRLNVAQNGPGGFNVNPVGNYNVPSINGQENRSNLFLLDGINNEGSLTSSYAVQPIVDDLEEFKIDSHNDQAQFGGVMGGIVNLVTKSGTNEFHGTLWEFLRNTMFDARSPFLQSVTPFTQNQFGGNIGGPVILPRYNGRNKTFFFFGIEQFINHTAGQTLFLDPTPAQWLGDFSAIPQIIYNPFSTQPDPNHPGEFIRTPFSNNQIPASLLDPNALAYKALYPAPVNTGIVGINGLVNTASIDDALGYDIRVDQQVGTRNSFWFRLSRFRNVTSSRGVFMGSRNSNVYPAYNLGVNWLHTFNPTSILQAQFGRVYAFDQTSTYISGAPDIPAGFAPSFACGFGGIKSCLIPSIALTGYAGGGEGLALNNSSNIYLGKANFSLIRGKHTLAMGGEINSNNNNGVLANDSIGFTPFQTSNLESPANTGDAFASFLLGVPDNTERRSRINNLTDGWVDGFYFQDMWKSAPRLTVNLGVRYDVTFLPILNPTPTHSNLSGGINFRNGTYIVTKAVGSLGSCDTLGQAPCIPGGALPANVVVSASQAILHNNYSNVQPRLGIAYGLNNKTAVRASFGMFTDNWAAITQMSQNYGGLWPSVLLVRAANLNATYVTTPMENPLGLGNKVNPLPPPDPFSQVAFYTDPHARNPYSEQWNAGFERQLSATTLLTVNYVGSHSLALNCCGFYNTALSPGKGSPQSRAPFSYIKPTWYDRSVGWGFYNALQASLNKRSSHGLSLLLSYTWSKATDVGCDGYFAEGCIMQNPYNLQSGYSVSGFDLPQSFTASWVYELPVGSGHRFVSSNKAFNAVISGWRLNGIASFTSGQPYTIRYSGDVANTGNNVQLVDIVGNPNLSNPTTARWINTAAFRAPAPFTWGNIGRNTLRSDWFKNCDFSIFRDFRLQEGKELQFRAEAFNTFNWPTWSAPVSTLNSPNFGQVLGNVSIPRQLQFALKFYF
jgi:hypothetical protein